MNIALFEDEHYTQLLPLVWLRAVFELRCGRDTLLDRVREHVPGLLARLLIREPLRAMVHERVELKRPPDDDWLLLNGRALLQDDVNPPEHGVAWVHNGTLVAARLTGEQFNTVAAKAPLFEQQIHDLIDPLDQGAPPETLRLIDHPWDLIAANEDELRRQCSHGGVFEGTVLPGAHMLGERSIHISVGALVKPGVVLDAEDGPIFIDDGARIEPNAVIQGPCYIGPKSIVRPGAVIRGGTSIGPVCKVGGEVEGSILHGYCNKQHDGFLGHSYVAQWVNLGADTVTSDLKNTYGTIRVSVNGVGVETGQHFLGSFIADHAKTGIGTILPTGCVLGVAANVFTQSPVPKFVPSFAWLTGDGLTPYRLEKAINIARTVMQRRDMPLTTAEEELLREIAEAAREVEAAGWPD